MSKLVLKNCFAEVDGVDLSDHISQVEISLKRAVIDTTNFSGGGKEGTQGLSDDSFSATFQQDFTGSVDDTLSPLYFSGEEFQVKVRPTSAPVSATNPEYSGTCKLYEYTPLSGKVGDLSESKVDFPTQRSGIARAVA